MIYYKGSTLKGGLFVTSNEVKRHFSDTVLLGLPAAPLMTLMQLRKSCGKRMHLFAHGRLLSPHLLPLVIPHRIASGRWSGVLLIQLLSFAESRGDKVLTLVPCTREAARFVDKNREALEAVYAIKNTDMQ